ncbi:methionyl-tRNA formyltransferase [Patescibacteria group bacterium]|nr:MAG: methionyl-tRNA formyltransferase [Patescibacteria group bacterium]
MKSLDQSQLIFWGTADFAVPILERLFELKKMEIVGVITRPDAPFGRDQRLTPSPVKIAAERLGLKVLTPEKLKEPAFAAEIQRLAPEVALVIAYGRIIPDALLAIPPKGTLNVHPSLLPALRGPSPIAAAILSGDKETGVTLMLLDSEMDHGPLIAQTRRPLTGKETITSLSKILSEAAADLVATALPRYLNNELVPQDQEHARATYCPLLSRESGKIDWTKTAVEIERMSRAYAGWPGIWTEWSDGKNRLRVKLFELEIGARTLAPGAIAADNGRLIIGASEGVVIAPTLQFEGKKPMSPNELTRGFPDFYNGRFE